MDFSKLENQFKIVGVSGEESSEVCWMYLQPFGKYGWELILRQGVRKCKMKHWVYLEEFNFSMLDIFQQHRSVCIFFLILTRRSRIHRRKLPWLIKELSKILTVKQHHSRSDFTH